MVQGPPELSIDRATGLLAQARQCPSPHCDARPDPSDIDLIVVHAISLPPGEFGGGWIDDLFTGQLPRDHHPYFRRIAHLEVSSHVLIGRDGELVQYVPLNERAWHAGPSSFRGRRACNDFSVGVELEGTDEHPYEGIQYEMLTALCAALIRTYPEITPERIAGHCDIAPDRKTDPGPYFDWHCLHARLAQLIPRTQTGD